MSYKDRYNQTHRKELIMCHIRKALLYAACMITYISGIWAADKLLTAVSLMLMIAILIITEEDADE